MEAIKTLEQLVYNLNIGPGYEGYHGLVKAIDLDPEEVAAICQWKKGDYTRIRFYNTDGLEGLISCWPSGIQGPIHNYELQQGWVKVLRGELTLEYYRLFSTEVESYGRKKIKTGEHAYLNDGVGYHRFANNEADYSIALHLYSDKITHWHEYNAKTGLVELVEVKVDQELEF